MMRRSLGGRGQARGIVVIGLGIAVAVLVSCSGGSHGSGRTASQAAPETTAATATTTTTTPTTTPTTTRAEEPESARRDRRSGLGAATTAPAQPPPPVTGDTPAPARRGSIHETVDAPPGVTARPVGIDQVAEFGNGVRARLAAIDAIEAEGHLPGERSGPAVAVTVQVRNGSSRTIGLDTVTVNLTAGGGASAYGVVVPDRPPLAGDLPAGESTSGEYVFTLAREDRAHVQVRVKYSADTPTVVFEGSMADG
jgi:hypothetical protein